MVNPRFSRIERLIGKEKLQALHNSFVAVVGLGAVGSYATEALARSGIGRLLLVDFDKVGESNINRQLFALISTVGKPKAEVACARVLDINPECKAEGRVAFIDPETLPKIFAEKPDLVIDAIDSMGPKVELLSYCYHNQIPIMSSMGAALRTDPLQIKTGDIFDTQHCPLAAQVRQNLRKKKVGRGIECVFSTEKVNFEYTPADQETEAWDFKRGRRRKVLGSLPTLTGIFGLTLANLAIKRLIKF